MTSKKTDLIDNTLAIIEKIEEKCGGPGSGRPGPCPKPGSGKKPPKKPKKPPEKTEWPVVTAKKLGFEPTSRDPFINQQQANEFLAQHKAKTKAAAAKKSNTQPKSSSDELHKHMVIAELGPISANLKINLKNPVIAKAIKAISAIKDAKARVSAAMTAAKSVNTADAWDGFKSVATKAFKAGSSKFKEPRDALIKSTATILKSYIPTESLAARMVSAAIKEIYK